MKRRPFLIWFLVGLLSCLGMSCSSQIYQLTSSAQGTASVTITVSAAASLQDVLDAIAPQFQTAYPQINVDYNFGSSGALQRQIEQGAPADLFFSAGVKPMDQLSKQGLIVSGSHRPLVTNRLVLVAPATSQQDITHLEQLKSVDIRRFAVGEFRSVPAGQYAEQVFANLDLLESLQSKFVFGNNVRAVLAAVESGNAELGMVYATDAVLSPQVKVLTTIPTKSHSPIVYPIGVVQNASHPAAAQAFIDFLNTETAQNTFERFGFGRV
ncbi:molybdate ABC transporter substrate-binding protein [Acaryochloris sp. IP29b_bin.137]|uniref:molybdate ABC transporter substrate-binding protein n=1 Tax=Acaryochloris sp. IP29b_bin.137 TaxID=2969217 RepID=UPI00260E8807|nr:molybdate ABC transporter substrate-binding protein [Acaryochloris sp. IP29b_bin.137]